MPSPDWRIERRWRPTRAPSLAGTAQSSNITPVAKTKYDADLFERLRALRRELADAADVPPYVVFSDRSLAEMATYFPQSSQRLLNIHGVGQRKLEAYGERFLEVIRAYCAERGAAAHGRAPLRARR